MPALPAGPARYCNTDPSGRGPGRDRSALRGVPPALMSEIRPRSPSQLPRLSPAWNKAKPFRLWILQEALCVFYYYYYF